MKVWGLKETCGVNIQRFICSPVHATGLSDYRRYPNQQANECDYQHDEGNSFGDLSEARYTGREIGHLGPCQFVIFIHGFVISLWLDLTTSL